MIGSGREGVKRESVCSKWQSGRGEVGAIAEGEQQRRGWGGGGGESGRLLTSDSAQMQTISQRIVEVNTMQERF